MTPKTITIKDETELEKIDFSEITEVIIDLKDGLSGPGQALDLAIKIWGLIGNDKIPIKIRCDKKKKEQRRWAFQFGLIPI